jgi:hypothetical protein
MSTNKSQTSTTRWREQAQMSTVKTTAAATTTTATAKTMAAGTITMLTAAAVLPTSVVAGAT